MSKAGAEWTDRRLDDLAAALEPVPARVAVLEATVDHLAEENRTLRAELVTTQRYLLQMSCAFVAALLGGAGAIIAALL
jgi:hypothetical protein